MNQTKVLIADDDRYTRKRMNALLLEWGYEVATAEDGTDALVQLVSTEPPAVAILDWIMPSMTGPEVCQAFRLQEPDAPTYLMLLTIRNRPPQLIEGLEAGADDYLIKPYDEGILKARLEVGVRLHDATVRAARAARLRSSLEMAGAMCHEINQPLQAIMGNAELLACSIVESDSNFELVQEIRDAAERLGGMTKKLMKLARYETKPYLVERSKIVDIERSSVAEPEKQ